MEKYNILLIEDDIRTGEIVKSALELGGDMRVDWAKDGDEALATMEAGKYDLIISDIKMPNKTGDMVIAEIRKIDEFVSVLVYTNYHDEPEIMRNLLNLQIDGYYQKGGKSDIWELVAKAKNILEPFSKEKREQFLNQLPKDIFKEA